MSDDEVMRFEITDYDIDNEFNPNRHRRKNKKEEQIYGMWAKDSDEDDNEDNIRQKTRKPKDYSAPIDFVSGGIQQAGKKDPNAKKQIESTEPSSSHQPTTADSSEEEPATPPHESDTAGIRKAGQGLKTMNLGGNVGNWEKHTKGIGAKLLLQMGYKPGQGLGKNLQGISAPVEASLRKGRGAIGAYGPEKAAQKMKKEQELRLKAKEDKEDKKDEKTYHWKKSHKGRYFYRDSNDVIQEGKPVMHSVTSNEMSHVPVIDMTGREKRVLSGYHALRSNQPRFEHEPRRKCNNFTAPELMHNLEVMLECCEQDIIQNARELHTAEDEIVVLERDIAESNKVLAKHDEVVETVQGIIQLVEQLNKNVSLDTAYDVLCDLKETYPLEYEMFNIGGIAGTVVSPLLSSALLPWDALSDHEKPVKVFSKWRPLLNQQAYNLMVRLHLFTHIETVAKTWNPRNPWPMVNLISSCMDICDSSILEPFVNDTIIKRLMDELQSWDPTQDAQQVHSWILPWDGIPVTQPYLSRSVHPLIRSRLSAALSAWHPSDPSALPLLSVWRNSWGEALKALLLHHVAPKIELSLQMQMVHLDDAKQHSAWQWCLNWLELLGPITVSSMVCRSFLPRWLAAFAAWLNTTPTHATVLKAYTDFKKTFPEEILREVAVRDVFRKALDMMNRSADIDDSIPPPPPRISIPEVKDKTRIADAVQATTQSFSELLETKCSERGITYLPLPGKYREGRPLYKIGRMQCYVLRNVIMYSNDAGRSWLPISLDRILGLAEE